MGASQTLVLEQFLEGKGFVRRSRAVAIAAFRLRSRAVAASAEALARRRLDEGGLLTGSGAKLLRACDLPSASPVHRSFSEGGAFDALLAGLPDRKLVEVVGRRSSGRFSIALSALASATTSGRDAAFVDLGDQLDPQAAAQAGVDLERVLWVRPRRVQEALAAAEMLLATGFRLVVADMGLSPRGGRFIPDAAWVRLARAVEAQGSTLLLLAPYRMSGFAADAVISAAAARAVWRGSRRASYLLAGISSRLTLEKYGRVTPGHSATISLSVPEAISCQPALRASGDRVIGRSGDRDPKPGFSDHKSQITNHKSSSLPPSPRLPVPPSSSLPASPRLRVPASS